MEPDNNYNRQNGAVQPLSTNGIAPEPPAANQTTLESPTVEPIMSASEPPIMSAEPISISSATTTSPIEPTKKPNKVPIIVLLIVLILITGGAILALGITGIINFGFSGSGPSSKVSKEVCEKYGNTYTVEEDKYIPESLKENVVTTYTCNPENDDSSSDGNEMAFIIYEFNENVQKLPYFIDMIKEADNFPVVGTLEKSDTFVKVVTKRSNRNFSYSVLYDRFYGIINASSAELAEDILSELKFPDRSHITTSEYESEVIAADAHNKSIVDKVSTALLKYQSTNGSLPTITPDEGSDWQTNIDGSGDTNFDEFYNTLGELNRYNGGVFAIDALGTNNTSLTTSSDNIVVRYGYYCVITNDYTYAQPGQDENIFTVTLNKVNGDTICAGPSYSYEGAPYEEVIEEEIYEGE